MGGLLKHQCPFVSIYVSGDTFAFLVFPVGTEFIGIKTLARHEKETRHSGHT